MITCIISPEWATFPGSVIFKHIVKTKCHYESPNGGSHHYSGQQKTCFAALHRDVVQTLQEIRKLLQYWEELL